MEDQSGDPVTESMISPEYCRTMARYNAWQNTGLRSIVQSMDEGELRRDRGAFFGSIWKTVNHLLWADQIWMSRFEGLAKPAGGIVESLDYMSNPGTWAAEREQTDERIGVWASRLGARDLEGDLKWFSGAAHKDIVMPRSLCVMHFFNHQTHHRGQIHAMLTHAHQEPEVTDLFMMPESA